MLLCGRGLKGDVYVLEVFYRLLHSQWGGWDDLHPDVVDRFC